ncbi:hypothetical protein BOX15_Mlig005443g1, partial [Macrostomum lignano]
AQTASPMFSTSSQKRRWLFESPDELDQLRQDCHTRAVRDFAHRHQLSPADAEAQALTQAEANLLVSQYATVLVNTCRSFKPDLPPTVTATAVHYFRRFYLLHSPMEVHPRDVLFTCLYLACKVDEFSLSIGQFAENIPRNKEKYVDLILNSELYLIDKLGFDLIVHAPFRPLEGLLLKAAAALPGSIDLLGRKAVDFVILSLTSDAAFLFPPAQIALAAFVDSAEGLGLDAGQFVLGQLCDGDAGSSSKLMTRIRQLLRDFPVAEGGGGGASEALRLIDRKLAVCRDPAGDPDSQLFKDRRARIQEDAGRFL